MKNCLECRLPMPGADGRRLRHVDCAIKHSSRQAFERWKKLQAAAGGPKHARPNKAPCRDCGETIPPEMGQYTIYCQACLDVRFEKLLADPKKTTEVPSDREIRGDQGRQTARPVARIEYALRRPGQPGEVFPVHLSRLSEVVGGLLVAKPAEKGPV